jgi:hypothetical protein
MVATIIAQEKASYYELKELLTLEDMFKIFEVIVINSYNEQAAIDAAKKHKGV